MNLKKLFVLITAFAFCFYNTGSIALDIQSKIE